MMLKFIGAVAIASLAACNGSAADRTSQSDAPRQLSGESGERTFQLADFDEVSLRGPDNIEVTVGNDFSVRAVGDQAVLDALEIEVRDGSLRVKRENDSWFDSGPDGEATIYVTMPAINGASLAGSGDMQIDRAEATHMELSVAGSGDLSVGEIRATGLDVDVAGSGDVSASGTATSVEISIAGSGNVSVGDLRSERMHVSIAGSGDVEGYATGEVEANLLGSGDVTVRGGARCRSSSLGSGELRCS